MNLTDLFSVNFTNITNIPTPESGIWWLSLKNEDIIPAIVAQGFSLIFGIPLNAFIFWRLMLRAFQRGIRNYHYCLAFRCALDILAALWNSISDSRKLFNYPDVFNRFSFFLVLSINTLTNLMVLIGFTLWKGVIDRLYRRDIRRIVLFSLAVSVQIVFLYMNTFHDDVLPWSMTECMFTTCTMQVLIFGGFLFALLKNYKEIVNTKDSFTVAFAVNIQRKILRAVEVEIVLEAIVAFSDLFRAAIYYAMVGKFSRQPIDSWVWWIFLQSYWLFICIGPFCRGAVTVWAFWDLLQEKTTKVVVLK